LGDLAKVPAELRTKTTVAEVMTGSDKLVTIHPAATLRHAAEVLSAHEFEQLPVVEDRKPLGILTHSDIVRVLQIREALDLRPAGESGGRPGGVSAAPKTGGAAKEITGR